MKKTLFFSICLIAAQTIANAQTFTETYSATTGWTMTNAATMNIQSGKLYFNQTHSAPVDERVTKPLGFVLNDNKWQMDFEFNPTSGASTGTASLIASLTSNTTDPIAATWPANPVNNNNCIAVYYTCFFGAPSSEFFISTVTKTNSNAYTNNALVSQIYCPPTQTYYIRLERSSPTTATISVFNDAQRTQHRTGSPMCFTLESGVNNLQYLQHGVFIPGHVDRYLSASIDNLTINNGLNASSTQTPVMSAQGNQISVTNPHAANYQWYSNGNSIPGATSIAYTIMNSGQYYVCATDINTCVTCADPMQFTFLGLDLPKWAEDVKIAPNPTHGFLTITGLPTQKQKISISNLLGQQILTTQNESPIYTLDLSALSSGSYLLTIDGAVWKINVVN